VLAVGPAKKNGEKMTIARAIKKLEKAAGHVYICKNGQQYWAKINTAVISFYRNGGTENAICFHCKRSSDEADSRSDWFPGSYFKTLTAAIKWAKKNY